MQTVQAALDVLRAVVDYAVPDPIKVETLRQAFGAEAEGLSAESLAHAILERYLMESKSRRRSGGGSRSSLISP